MKKTFCFVIEFLKAFIITIYFRAKRKVKGAIRFMDTKGLLTTASSNIFKKLNPSERKEVTSSTTLSIKDIHRAANVLLNQKPYPKKPSPSFDALPFPVKKRSFSKGSQGYVKDKISPRKLQGTPVDHLNLCSNSFTTITYEAAINSFPSKSDSGKLEKKEESKAKPLSLKDYHDIDTPEDLRLFCTEWLKSVGKHHNPFSRLFISDEHLPCRLNGPWGNILHRYQIRYNYDPRWPCPSVDVFVATHEFYCLCWLETLCVRRIESFKKSHEKWLDDFREYKKAFCDNFAKLLFDYVAMICAGELRHAATQCEDNCLINWSSNHFNRKLMNNSRIKKTYRYCEGSHRTVSYGECINYDPYIFLDIAKHLFVNYHWSGSGYGGQKWGNIAEAGLMYGKVSSEVFIDHLVDIAHNNNFAFDKSSTGLIKTPLSSTSYECFLDGKAMSRSFKDYIGTYFDTHPVYSGQHPIFGRDIPLSGYDEAVKAIRSNLDKTCFKVFSSYMRKFIERAFNLELLNDEDDRSFKDIGARISLKDIIRTEKKSQNNIYTATIRHIEELTAEPFRPYATLHHAINALSYIDTNVISRRCDFTDTNIKNVLNYPGVNWEYGTLPPRLANPADFKIKKYAKKEKQLLLFWEICGEKNVNSENKVSLKANKTVSVFKGREIEDVKGVKTDILTEVKKAEPGKPPPLVCSKELLFLRPLSNLKIRKPIYKLEQEYVK